MWDTQHHFHSFNGYFILNFGPKTVLIVGSKVNNFMPPPLDTGTIVLRCLAVWSGEVSRRYHEKKRPQIWHAGASWSPSKWLDKSHGLLSSLILAQFWLDEMAQIAGIVCRTHRRNCPKFCMLMNTLYMPPNHDTLRVLTRKWPNTLRS